MKKKRIYRWVRKYGSTWTSEGIDNYPTLLQGLQRVKDSQLLQRLHRAASSSDQISNIHGHLVDLRGVVLLNVPQDAYVIILHKINGHTLATVST